MQPVSSKLSLETDILTNPLVVGQFTLDSQQDSIRCRDFAGLGSSTS
jgi:hypothetical protein